MSLKALVIDDDPDILAEVGYILDSLGHEHDNADSVKSARERLDGGNYTYVLLDLEIPIHGAEFARVQNGQNLLEEIVQRRGHRPTPVVIVMTAHGTDGPDLAVDVMQAGAVDYVTKPFDSVGRTLDSRIRNVLTRHGIDSSSAPQVNDDGASKGDAGDGGRRFTTFDGGSLVFYTARVTLCDADICSGQRCDSRRIVLELLSRRHKNMFVRLSGEDLEDQAKRHGAKGTAAGLIRDLRNDIEESLKQAGIACTGKDVILSGDQGYRLAECLTVEYADPPRITDITDISDTDEASNVRDQDLRNVRDDEAARRREWILNQLEAGVQLKAPMVAAQFKRDKKTAQRDLDALRNEGTIEFVGDPRTGYYRLFPGK